MIQMRIKRPLSFPEDLNGKEVTLMFVKLRTKGQGLVEYALIIMLVAIVIIIILTTLGPAIGNIFSEVVSHI
jgi:pilus assembly protein Flp/PilA